SGGEVAIVEYATSVNVGKEIEDGLSPGIYSSDIAILMAGANTTSMSNSAFDKNGNYVEVTPDGKAYLYVTLKSIFASALEFDPGEEIPEDYDFETGGYLSRIMYGTSLDTDGKDVEVEKIEAEYIAFWPDSTIDDKEELPPRYARIELKGVNLSGTYSVGFVIPPMNYAERWARIMIKNLDPVANGTDLLPKYDKSVIKGEIGHARNALRTWTREYIDGSTLAWISTWNIDEALRDVLEGAIADAQTVYDAGPTAKEDILAARDALRAKVEEIREAAAAAIDPETVEALEDLITTATDSGQGNKTDTAYAELQTAIETAQAALTAWNKTQITIDNALSALSDAIEAFNNSEDRTTLDKDSLADGNYTVRIAMRMASNPGEKSMAHDAVEHSVNLTVSGGAYYITLDFKGLYVAGFESVGNFGYLKELSYYEDFELGEFGAFPDSSTPAEVLTYQKDANGNDVADRYNTDANGNLLYKYPDLVRFPLVDKADYEDNLVPLHVFVPIMYAISPISGDQDVYMLMDWSSLKRGTVEENGGVADTEPLTARIAEAAMIKQAGKSDAAYAALKAAIAAARAVLDRAEPAQSEIDAALAALTVAIAAFNASADDTGAGNGGGNDNAGVGDAGLNQAPGGNAVTSLSTLKITAADKVWTGKKIASGFVLTAGGKKLAAGTDYTVASTGANKNIGAGTVSISGKGVYTGTATVKFNIVPKPVNLKSAKAGKGSLTIRWAKAPKAAKITKYQVRYKIKGAKSWKAKTVSAKSLTLKVGKLKKGKRYSVQVRAYKTVKGKKYYSAWSKTKTGGKVK
ncbi:MAG: NEAT domain-containing protein, partial [Clostridiales Family XIII bacterium]|nr:NEAT domain-containing protein [Clostridiales Family XIII bacterium]